MNSFDSQFKDLLKTILTKGYKKEDRTGTGTISYPGLFFRHDMAEGFPLLTLRKTPFKSAAVELEGFINGVTSKKWYQERGCGYWNQWCSPKKVKYGTDKETQERMATEDDLGLIYGSQMRDFHDPLAEQSVGVDQLKRLVNTLHSNPNDRRMVVSYWNPLALDYQALPACHTQFIVNVVNNRLNLTYTMRSCDFALGNNCNSYGLLLHLLAKEANYEEGVISGVFHDAHIYLNHLNQIEELLNRNSFEPPKIETERFISIFDWKAPDTKLLNYNGGETIKFPIAI